MALVKVPQLVPARAEHTVMRDSHVTCDLCGAASKAPDNWGVPPYDVDKVEVKTGIRHDKGSNYPEGGHGEVVQVDLCPTCFHTRLLPWLEREGAKPRKTEWEW